MYETYMGLRISTKQKKELKKQAKKSKVSISELIRSSIDNLLLENSKN